MKSSPIRVSITVDMEPDCPPYLSGWRGVMEGGPRLLEVFAGEGIQVTYFTTGDTAVQQPRAVADLVAAGHELACHGMTHRDFSTLSPADAGWEITESLRVLRGFASVSSFRAPYLRFPTAFLHTLADAGVSLDSSVGKYKSWTRGTAPPAALQRIPASATSSVLRLPAWLRDPILLSLGDPVVLFVHPWEFVDLTKETLRLDCRFRTGTPALNDLRDVIRLFKARGAQFLRMDRLAEQMA